MDTKTTRGLVLLATLSLLCASAAWAVGHAVFGLIFSALSAVAVLGAAARLTGTDVDQLILQAASDGVKRVKVGTGRGCPCLPLCLLT